MDYQPDMNQNRYEDKHSSGLATASIVMGTIAIATSCCIYSAIVASALSIIFALLSKGGEMTLDGKGKAGLILGIVGLVLTIIIAVVLIAWTIHYYGSFDKLLDYYNKLSQESMQYSQYK
jgi:uncharacterized membrane protein YqhA